MPKNAHTPSFKLSPPPKPQVSKRDKSPNVGRSKIPTKTRAAVKPKTVKPQFQNEQVLIKPKKNGFISG